MPREDQMDRVARAIQAWISNDPKTYESSTSRSDRQDRDSRLEPADSALSRLEGSLREITNDQKPADHQVVTARNQIQSRSPTEASGHQTLIKDTSSTPPIGAASASGPVLFVHEPQSSKACNDTWSLSIMAGSTDSVSRQDDSGRLTTWTEYAGQNRAGQPTLTQVSQQQKAAPPPTPSPAANINSWLDTVSKGPTVAIISLKSKETMIPDIHHRDINPINGTLRDPVEYNPVKRRLDNTTEDDNVLWRQNNMTSTLHITREIASRNRIRDAFRSSIQNKKMERAALEVEEQVPWPNAKCLIRPAETQDFAGIATIVNLEKDKTSSPQFFDSVTVADVELFYQHCREQLRPFVVAVPTQDEYLDRSKWPRDADDVYQEYLKFRQAQPVKKQEDVLGFALLTDARMGVFGKTCPGSRFSGLIKIGVHPDHRRKLCGTALLDRLLLGVMARPSVVEYKWDCPEFTKIYDKPFSHNQRQYTRVYVEVFSATKGDPELSWRRKMLENFGFKQVAYLQEAVKTDRHYESEWLDLSLWQLEARALTEVADRAPGQFLKA